MGCLGSFKTVMCTLRALERLKQNLVWLTDFFLDTFCTQTCFDNLMNFLYTYIVYSAES